MKILRLASGALHRVGQLCHRAAELIHVREVNLQEKRAAPWFKIDGDNTLRLDYDLTADSVVLDVGGYRGEWAVQIAARYDCQIHIFEAVPDFAEKLSRMFRSNAQIKVHPFGLGGNSRDERIRLDENRSSVFGNDHTTVPIRLVDVREFFQENKMPAVSLMKINIEGGEYELLERLLDCSLHLIIRDLQIQFHDFVPEAEKRRAHLRERLERTHRLTYDYPFVWENWRLHNTPAEYDSTGSV